MIIEELRDAVTESWDDFRSLDWQWRRLVVGGILAAIVMTVLAWKIMVPFILLAISVIYYLRRSRGEDSL